MVWNTAELLQLAIGGDVLPSKRQNKSCLNWSINPQGLLSLVVCELHEGQRL